MVHCLAPPGVAVVIITEAPTLAIATGVAHEQIQALELALGSPRNPRRGIGIGEVGCLEDHVQAELARKRLELLAPPSDDQHAPAVARQPPRKRLADATGRARDDGRLHPASTFAIRSGSSRAIRDRGTTMSNPASSARRFSSGCTCG